MNNINKNYPEIKFVLYAHFHKSLNGWFYIENYNNIGLANVCLKHGMLHSIDDKPSLIIKPQNRIWGETTASVRMYWYENGKQHRLGGPARIALCGESYAIHGIGYTEECYWNHPEVAKYKLELLLNLDE